MNTVTDIEEEFPRLKVLDRRCNVWLINRITLPRTEVIRVDPRPIQCEGGKGSIGRGVIGNDVVDRALTGAELTLCKQGCGVGSCGPCCGCGRVADDECGAERDGDGAGVEEAGDGVAGCGDLKAPSLLIADIGPCVEEMSAGKCGGIVRNHP